MPCRALEAFRRRGRGTPRDPVRVVLMPCRALEAFRPAQKGIAVETRKLGLNALSGIGGVQTRVLVDTLLERIES